MDQSGARSRKPDQNTSSLNMRETTQTNEAQVDKPKDFVTHGNAFDWWNEDRGSVFLLLFLYVLQGIPLGLAGSIPMLLAVSLIVIE